MQSFRMFESSAGDGHNQQHSHSKRVRVMSLLNGFVIAQGMLINGGWRSLAVSLTVIEERACAEADDCEGCVECGIRF